MKSPSDAVSWSVDTYLIRVRTQSDVLKRNTERPACMEDDDGALVLDQCGRVAVSGGTSLDYSTRVFDAAVAVGSEVQHAKLLEDCAKAFTARAKGDGEELSAGCTFWVPGDSKPTNALERLALDIFKHHTRGALFDASKSGAEWWTQCIDPEDDIGLHWDRDYDLQEEQGLLLHPHVATVTYLQSPPGAAPTLVLDCASPLLESDDPCGPIACATACWPATGRHLAFDGRMLHGAMSELTEGLPTLSVSATRENISSGRKKGKAAKTAKASAKAGKRVTFLVNCWVNHTPWGAEELPDTITSKLSALPDVKLMLGKASKRVVHGKIDKAVMAAAQQREWTFGDQPKSRLTLELPWPDLSCAIEVKDHKGANGTSAAPVLDLNFGAGRALLRPKSQAKPKPKAARPAKRKGEDGGASGKSVSKLGGSKSAQKKARAA